MPRRQADEIACRLMLTLTYKRNTNDIRLGLKVKGRSVMAKRSVPRQFVTSGAVHNPAKEAFARKVYDLMLKKGWRQADLAREAGLPRDAVSVYMRAQSLPTVHNLGKIAKAFGVDPEELIPARLLSEQGRVPVFEIRATHTPDLVTLRVNQDVPLSTAMKIAELLNAKAST